MSQDWRIETDAHAYLLHQRKRLDLDQRRPVIRQASDLVGPGIGAEATTITDFNDQLATFNGYYSAAPGALYAPNSTDSFIGFTVMDATLGGKQVFTSLVSGNEYARVFRRSPSDASAITFGAWSTDAVSPAMAYAATLDVVDSQVVTPLAVGVSTWMKLPQMKVRGQDSTYNRSNTILSILRPGIYTGHLMVSTVEFTFFAHLIVEFPWEDGQAQDHILSQPSGEGILVPLNFCATNGTGFVRVTAVLGDLDDHSILTAQGLVTRLHVTRIGDA